MNDQIRILMDLKPVLDGHAGIPQETRLLFAGLNRLGKPFTVEGMLQHGASSLTADINPSYEEPGLNHIISQARSVISFYTGGRKGIPAYLKRACDTYLELKKLQWWACSEKPLKLGFFDAVPFGDFIWNRCFSKTLQADDQPITAAARYRILCQSRKLLQQIGQSALCPGCKPQQISIDTRGYDIFLAQTPFPGRVMPGTAMIVRYHDAVPIFMPHTTRGKASDLDTHLRLLQDNVATGAHFSCISEATRNDLLKLFPEVEERVTVIPNMVSSDYFAEETPKGQAITVILNRAALEGELKTDVHLLHALRSAAEKEPFKYLLMVATIEPRKNHQLLISAWEQIKNTTHPALKLVLVGEPGWDFSATIRQAAPWAARGELFHLTNIPAAELRVLYKHAAATVCPSLSEGFDYSGVEAMCCRGIVAASDISVHREIYANGAVYFNPFATDHAAATLDTLLTEGYEAQCQQLHQAGAIVSERYRAATVLPQWAEYIASFTQGFEKRLE